MASLIHEPDRPRKPWRVDFSQVGRRHTRRFATKREAQIFVGDLARGNVTSANLTLNAWSPRWTTSHGPEWESRTVRDRSRDMDRFVLPYIGHLRLREIGRQEIRAWRAEIVASGLATPYVAQQAMKTLSTCLGDAVDDGIIPANPCLRIKPLEWRRREREPATLADVESVRAAMTSDRDRAAVSLMAYAGLRPGELLRLQWSDVREATIVVRRGARVSGRTKTGSVRTIPIIVPVADDLAALQRDGALVLGIRNWDNWTLRSFRPARKSVGVTREPYALRHTAASLWIAEGRTVLEVAHLLGHSSPRLTMETYGHLFGEAQLRRGESIAKAAMRARKAAHAERSRAAKSSRAAAPVIPSP